jgi:histidinol-phosphate aminotransferase
MSIEFTSRMRAIPVYPAASTYAFDGELVKLASNETPWGPHAAVLEAVEASLRTLNRYPDPTATALPVAEIDAFVASVPRHVCVVLDEAYIEFSTLQDPDASLPLVERHPNLVLLRTFSKIYGLCGLRIGYGLCGEDFRLGVDRVRQPFSVNSLAQAAAAEALLHQDEVARRAERTAIERLFVEEGLAERGLETTDSQANFSWVSLGDADEESVIGGLARRGVIVRAGAALGQEGWLRVTYGTRHENERFLQALDESLAEA